VNIEDMVWEGKDPVLYGKVGESGKKGEKWGDKGHMSRKMYRKWGEEQ
jgi:hypothetical protein